jgi:hypothetical protein
MKKLTQSAILLAIMVAGALPAFAGSVYVPLATQRDIGPYSFSTEVTVANKAGTENRRFRSFFIPSGVDGTIRPEGTVSLTTVVAGTSNRFIVDLDSNDKGMLEIDGAPQIAVAARLVASQDGEEVSRVNLPVISSDNVIKAGETAYLLAWDRNTQTGDVVDFGLMNLSTEGNSCELDVVDADGNELISTLLLALHPLSHVQFEDALGLIGVDGVELARVGVTCNHDFYIYSLRYNLGSGDLSFQTPAGTGLSTLGLDNGVAPPPPASGCNNGNICFTETGIFHTPTPGFPVRRISYDPPDGTYQRLFARVEVRNGGWNPANPSGTHNIFWLVRDRNRDMFGYVNVRGPNTNDLFVRHGFNLGQGDKPRLSSGFQFPVGATYRFEYTYDTAARLIELIVFNESGTPILNLRGTPNINNINMDPGQQVLLDFGFRQGVNPNEPATYGWDYKNLLIELTPKP